MSLENTASEPQFLKHGNGARIAYRMLLPLASEEKRPWVIFLGGFRSDMNGTKALALESFCREAGLGFIRFDYRGHGESDGKFIEHGIANWLDDAKLIISRLTLGKVILIGSSMGGWIAHLFARQHPEKIAALIGIAAAPDFTEREFWPNFSKEERERIEKGGVVLLPSGYDEPYEISHALIKQGKENLVFDKPFHAPYPIRYFYGAQDKAVSLKTTLNLFSHVNGDDIELIMVKTSDHSFSSKQDLAHIFRSIEMLTS